MKLFSLKVTVKSGQFKRLSLQETSEKLANQMYLEAICYPCKMKYPTWAMINRSWLDTALEYWQYIMTEKNILKILGISL